MEPESSRRRYGARPRLETGMSRPERLRLCRQLRERQTSAEAFFWELVRDRRLLGRKFRRQHPLGNFVVDFYCPEIRLAVELDGGVHEAQIQRDRARDSFLAMRGVTVLRISNADLMDDPLAALDRIEKALLEIGGRCRR